MCGSMFVLESAFRVHFSCRACGSVSGKGSVRLSHVKDCVRDCACVCFWLSLLLLPLSCEMYGIRASECVLVSFSGLVFGALWDLCVPLCCWEDEATIDGTHVGTGRGCVFWSFFESVAVVVLLGQETVADKVVPDALEEGVEEGTEVGQETDEVCKDADEEEEDFEQDAERENLDSVEELLLEDVVLVSEWWCFTDTLGLVSGREERGDGETPLHKAVE